MSPSDVRDEREVHAATILLFPCDLQPYDITRYHRYFELDSGQSRVSSIAMANHHLGIQQPLEGPKEGPSEDTFTKASKDQGMRREDVGHG